MKKLFEELEKSTNTGCWEFNLETQELYWSKQTFRIHELPFDYKPNVEEAINFYHPEDQAKITEDFQKCVEEFKEYKLIARIITANNTLKLVEAYGKPLFEEGKVKSVFGTFKDLSKEAHLIHKRQKISSDLTYLKKTLDQFFIVAKTDKNGIITEVNEKFCQISKYSEEELVGKSHTLVNSGYHEKGFFKKMWETITKGKAWEGQICNKAKDGSIYWVHSFIFPEFNQQFEIDGYTALRFNITDKKFIETELKDERERATFTGQLAAIGEMSAGIAHEIANPLSIINIQADNLMMDQVEEDRKLKSYNYIRVSIDRIKKIIDGLHHLSQLSRTEEIKEHKIKDILDYTFGFCEEALKGQHITLSTNYENEELKLIGNELKISQIVLNLINNAKDAIIEHKSPERWIKVDVLSAGNFIELRVIDSGPGIPSELHEKILDSFFTTKEKGKGTGLGLSLVQQFTAEHNGQFELDTSLTNTCFIVRLPKCAS